jgi:hypothetical protein
VKDNAMRDYDDSRCYVEHLIAEHRRLHRMLRMARAAIAAKYGPDRDATNADIVRVLRQVREELEHHFAEEDGGGCLDEVVSRCPWLSAEARRIEAEHPRLLERLDGLIAQTSDSDQSLEKQLALEREFSGLCEQLDEHETAENVMLRKGFGADINGEEPDRRTLIYDV